MKSLNYLFFIVVLLVLPNAHAHEPVQSYNQISLEVSSSAEVENDTMIVSMYALEEGSKAVMLANKVNKKINWALEKLKQNKAIKVETESYSTNPVYSKNQIIAWRVKQSIKLESRDMPSMSEMLGELQQQLKLNGISFDVSPENRQQQTQILIDQALTAFNKRATQIANKLQRDSYKIVKIHVSTSENTGRYKYGSASAMMAVAEVAPVIAAGDKTLNVRVSGTVELE
jgi:predicted secreted protein